MPLSSTEGPGLYLSTNTILGLLASDPAEHATGPTVLFRILDCARQVRLDGEHFSAANALAPEFEKRNVGTLVHKLCEIYHLGLDPARHVAKQAGHPAIDPLLVEAWGLFEKYRTEFSHDWWGWLSGAELQLVQPGPHGEEGGRIDAVWEVDSAAVERIEGRFGIRLEGPGLYGWDLKTTGQRNNNLYEMYVHDPQPYRYLRLLRAAGHEVNGFIVFMAIRYKTDRQDRFQAVCLPAQEVLSAANTARQAAIVAYAAAKKAADEARPSNCRSYGQLCRHFTEGRCPGY